MQIKRLQSGDEKIARRVIAELKLNSDTFPDSTDYTKRLISSETNYLLAALDGDKPAGFLIAYELQRIDCNQSMMLFYEIEVSEQYQRQGIGKKLIAELKQFCREKNILKMWVFTSESNIAAQNLYKSTGAVQSSDPEFLFEYFPDF